MTAYPHASGADLFVQAAGIDSGYNADAVFGFCTPRWNRRCWPIKGDVSGDKGHERPIWPAQIKLGKPVVLGVHQAKSHTFARLRGIMEPGPCYSHFPYQFWSGATCDKGYFDQLTVETLRSKYTGRKHVPYYHCPNGARNEALDLTVYAYAALLGYCRVTGQTTNAAINEARMRLLDQAALGKQAAAARAAVVAPKVAGGGWLGGGRPKGWLKG